MSFVDKISKQSKAYEKIVDACYDILVNEPVAENARVYLEGRLPFETWRDYGFGYFPADDDLKLLTSRVDKSILESCEIIRPRVPVGIRGHFGDHNLLMPFKDVHGNLISLLGRSLLDKEQRESLGLQKYKYTKDSKKSLYVYGLDIAKREIIKKNSVICVEGQFDCIACHMRGIRNCIAFGGADMSPYQFFQIHRYTNNIILVMDNDVAGQKAKVRIRNIYGSYANIESAMPPEGYKDLEEFWRKEDDQDWCRAVTLQLQQI